MIYEVGAITLLFFFVGFAIGWIMRGLFNKKEKGEKK